MSKTIDRSDLSALSQEDLIYLRDRGQLSPAEEAEHLEGVTVNAPEDVSLEDRPNTGDVGPELDEVRAALAVEAAEADIIPGVTPAQPGQPVNSLGAVPQTQSKAQRKAAAARRSGQEG